MLRLPYAWNGIGVILHELSLKEAWTHEEIFSPVAGLTTEILVLVNEISESCVISLDSHSSTSCWSTLGFWCDLDPKNGP